MDTENLLYLMNLEEKMDKIAQTLGTLGGGSIVEILEKSKKEEYGKLRAVSSSTGDIEINGCGILESVHTQKKFTNGGLLKIVVDDETLVNFNIGYISNTGGGISQDYNLNLKFEKQIRITVRDFGHAFYRLKE